MAAKDADAAAGTTRALAANSPVSLDAAKSESSLLRKVGEFESVDKQTRDHGKTSDAPVMNYSIAGTLTDRANLAVKEQQSPAVVADALSQNASPAVASRQAGNTGQSLPISRGGAQQLVNGGLAGQNQLRSAVSNNEGSTTLANNTYFNRQLQNQSAPGAVQQLSLGRPDQRQESDAPPQFALESAARQRRSEIPSEFRAGFEAKQAAPAVLERFSIEQIGSIVRVTDADGSLYQGSFFTEEPGAADERLSPKGGAQLMTIKRDANVAPRRLAFRASGTNRTLNQLVVINGRFVDSGTNIGAFVASTPAAKLLEREQTAQVVPAQSAIPQTIPPRGFGFRKASESVVAPTNSVNAVEGTVRVGDSAERPFHAQRVAR
jgi:hypothetical protein